ncbi:MAG TPA: nuclear transport factor 2 family protein, partial [Rhizomicrobium sp.]|nr:nuclear transport factor 2 family protein [Rhizomicrobium sp.]
ENKHDAAALGGILDGNFISTFAANKPRGKAEFIKGIVAGPIDPTQSQSLTDVSVVIEGDTAVTVGTDTFHSATKPPLALRYTITYVRKGGRWLALGEHIVTIPSGK